MRQRGDGSVLHLYERILTQIFVLFSVQFYRVKTLQERFILLRSPSTHPEEIIISDVRYK